MAAPAKEGSPTAAANSAADTVPLRCGSRLRSTAASRPRSAAAAAAAAADDDDAAAVVAVVASARGEGEGEGVGRAALPGWRLLEGEAAAAGAHRTASGLELAPPDIELAPPDRLCAARAAAAYEPGRAQQRRRASAPSAEARRRDESVDPCHPGRAPRSTGEGGSSGGVGAGADWGSGEEGPAGEAVPSCRCMAA